MNDQRLREVDELFQAALELPPEQRRAFLNETCPTDTELRTEVESLLSAHEEAKDFIEDSPSDVAASLLAESRPKQVGPYKIERILGAGGMGEVYLAEDTRLNRKVAIKFLTPARELNEQGHRRFLREARAAAKLDHPNVCAIYEINEVGVPFIVMPYIEGETLDSRMKRQRLELSEALSIAIQVADALAEAHAQRVVHRDIKPANIIITPRGQAKVMDFGLAKISANEVGTSEAPSITLTTPGLIMGTLPYMSPEQVRGEELDERSDVFSFGVVLYEMLTGNQPFECESGAATAAAILTREPPSITHFLPDSPVELQQIVQTCLKKDVEGRYQTMSDVASDIHCIARPPIYPTSEGAQTKILFADRISAQSSVTRVKPSSLKPVLAIAAGLIVIAIVVISTFYARRGPVGSTSRSQISSLAVLPLNNLSGDVKQEYFADGMTEAVTAALGRISALRVISRTSVMQYKTINKSLPEIAHDLNVDAIIEGSVQRSGNQVRVTVNLIRAQTDEQLWTQTYNRDLSDVLAFQSEVASAIAREIQVTLTPQEKANLAGGRQVNSEAYDNYLLGKFHETVLTDSENQQAIKLLEHAVAQDPNFAIGYAELAQAYTRRLNSFAPGEPEWEKKAMNAVEKALLLDPNVAEAYLARGVLLWTHSHGFPHEAVVAEYRKALSLNPNFDEAHHQLAVVFLHIGFFDEALNEIQTAIAINPSNTYAQYRLGSVYLYQGRTVEALSVYEKYRDVSANPEYQPIWALFDLGRKDEALERVKEAMRRDPDDAGGIIGSMKAMLAAATGDRGEAEALIKVAGSKQKGFIHFHHTAYNIACAYALMNQPEEAVEWLQKAADDGLPCYSLFLRDQNLSALRNDPGFINFMEKQKEQWQYRQNYLKH
jgi:eukaryotic-like serine/threonine-protein kinase